MKDDNIGENDIIIGDTLRKNVNVDYFKMVEKYYNSPYCDKLSQKMKEYKISSKDFFDGQLSYAEGMSKKGIKLSEDTFRRIQSGENGTSRKAIKLIAKILTDILKERGMKAKITPDDICTYYSANFQSYLLEFESHIKHIRASKTFKSAYAQMKECYSGMPYLQACKFAVFFEVCFNADEEIHQLIQTYSGLSDDKRSQLLEYALQRKTTIETQINNYSDKKISGYMLLADTYRTDVELYAHSVKSQEDLWELIENKIDCNLANSIDLMDFKKTTEYMLSFSDAIFSFDLGDDESRWLYSRNAWKLAVAYRLLQGKQKAGLISFANKLLRGQK